MRAVFAHPPLRRVQKAARDRERAELQWKTTIIAAHAEGFSLREIAEAAGVGHTRVLQIVRGE